MALADELTTGTPPAGLILCGAAFDYCYLDLITDQMTTQLKTAVDGGSMTERMQPRWRMNWRQLSRAYGLPASCRDDCIA
ncbi:MAG: hypothetical protein R2855_10105 [Thermomicrobiales bacterium]